MRKYIKPSDIHDLLSTNTPAQISAIIEVPENYIVNLTKQYGPNFLGTVETATLERIDPVLDIIHDPQNENLTVLELSEICGLSKIQISKILKAHGLIRALGSAPAKTMGRPPIYAKEAKEDKPGISMLFKYRTAQQIANFVKLDIDILMQILK